MSCLRYTYLSTRSVFYQIFLMTKCEHAQIALCVNSWYIVFLVFLFVSQFLRLMRFDFPLISSETLNFKYFEPKNNRSPTHGWL